MVPKLSFVEIAAMIGKMLKELSEGMPRLRSEVIPVELHIPERAAKQTVDMSSKNGANEEDTDR